VTYHGGGGTEADFLGCWLEVIEPDQDVNTEKKEEVLDVK
jgi:hypothetical protein